MVETDETRGALQEILHAVFAKDDLRSKQYEAVVQMLSGNDATVLLPTGAGKSLIYQIVGLCQPGCTIVVDPLVALMEDQIDVNFVQECKIREDETGKIKAVFSNEGYNLEVGPCSRDTKKPSAGVGCARKENKVEVFVPTYLTRESEEAVETGRVERYMIDLGWEQMMQVFNLYGKVGGGRRTLQ